VEVKVNNSFSTYFARWISPSEVVPVLMPLQTPEPRVYLSAVATREPAALAAVDLGHVEAEEALGVELAAADVAVRGTGLFLFFTIVVVVRIVNDLLLFIVVLLNRDHRPCLLLQLLPRSRFVHKVLLGSKSRYRRRGN
jgi:hypothetical protein